jgi:hypothetical protein
MVWARSYEAEDFGSSASLTSQLAAGEKSMSTSSKGVESVSNYYDC